MVNYELGFPSVPISGKPQIRMGKGKGFVQY